MAKSALPIIAVAGAAYLLLSGKKKASGGASSTADPNQMDSGTLGGWDWRVMRVNVMTRNDIQYIGEVRNVGKAMSEWTGVIGPAPTQDEAKSRAISFIHEQVNA